MADANQALQAALAVLAEFGLATRGVAAVKSEPTLVVEHAGRRLELCGDTELAADSRVVIESLLTLALTRIREQEELDRVRERMEMLAGASFEGIMFHVDGVIIDANQRLAEMLGYEHDEVLGADTLQRCVAPEDLPAVLERMRSRYEGEYVITGVRKDGSRFRAELQSKQGKLGDRPLRVAAVRDVTERERTHAMLRESEARLRQLAREAFDVIVLSRDGVVVDVGGPIEGLFGVTREEAIGARLLDLMPEESRRLAETMIFERRSGAYQAEFIAKSGEVVPVAIVAVMSTLDGDPVRVAGLRDLRGVRRLEEERRKLEQRVQRGQRLESLGVLAGGIAHDFNNLLVGVLGNADFLIEQLGEPSLLKASHAIRSAAERAAALTAQMLAYAGQRDLGKRESLDLGVLFEELGGLLEAALSKKARLELSIEAGSVIVGDRATITQVFMNLLTNASDALAEQPGIIRVQTARVHEPDERWQHALGSTLGPGDFIETTVSDSGVGMSDATLARIFEPFFSTKDQGHGLGLAACLGIVAAHKGAILVESAKGQGSRFSVLLPRGRAVESPVEAVAKVPCGAHCRVLVVDDEHVVRSFLRRTLERRGYSVHEAFDGVAALEFLAAQDVDVVLLDMSMPKLDGAEVLRRLRAGGSRVKVILSSGYTEVEVERELEAGSFQGFLTKPYGLAELVELLDRVLKMPEVVP